MPHQHAKPVLPPAGPQQALYLATLQQALSDASLLMGRLVEQARAALSAQASVLHDPLERDAVGTAANQLQRCQAFLISAYPQALQKLFTAGPTASVADVPFDQLELMDDAQVQISVTLTREQHDILQLVESDHAALTTLMCSMQGLHTVRPEHNPLRPENYIQALKDVVHQTGLPSDQQLLWFNAMSHVLGPHLRLLYQALRRNLSQQGVQPALFTASTGFDNHGGAVGVHPPQSVPTGPDDLESTFQTQAAPLVADPLPPQAATPERHPHLLTLDKLRRLLKGELGTTPIGKSRVQRFAAQFAQQFEQAPPPPRKAPARAGFDATVPAALEALAEMQQVDQMMHKLQQRRDAPGTSTPPEADSIEAQRATLRQGARDLAQLLSLEVVTLMVDNMARDPRLLEPVRQVVRNLEPALLRLALVDPRFFTHQEHPARRLLHALTHRSLGFDSSAATGFGEFLQGLQLELAPLYAAPVESAEVFERKLEALQHQWELQQQGDAGQRDVAVGVLAHAEARNLLAEQIGRTLVAHPDAARVPSVVIDFLRGPWAQVLAQSRLRNGQESAGEEKFEALAPALLWSAHPELAATDPAKLGRLVPRLLGTLREGLETIHYPATRTSEFLEALMAIHQGVFKNQPAEAAARPGAGSASAPDPAPRSTVALDADPWIAPEEAAASNFVSLQDEATEPPASEVVQVGELPLGSWVELWTDGQWRRTQLTWASPQGTLFLFTSAFGATQSMTRRSCDRLLANGRLRLVSAQSVEAGALNAVVQTAMRNSVETLY